MAAVTVALVEDRGSSEVYMVAGPGTGTTCCVELAKPDGPARLCAERQPDGQVTLRWKTEAAA